MVNFKDIERSILESVGIMVNSVGTAVREAWVRIAQSSLAGKVAGKTYASAIKASGEGTDRVVLTLDNPRAVALELGHESYDLRESMLKTRTWRDVPMHISHQASKVDRGSSPSLDKRLRATYKATQAAASGPGSTSARLRSVKRANRGTAGVHFIGGPSATGRSHPTRRGKPHPKTGAETGIIMFRRMSWNGKPWIVRARSPKNLVRRVLQEMPRILHDVFNRGH